MVSPAHAEAERKPEPEAAADGKKPAPRILYAVGPGNVVGQYHDLLAGKQPSFQPGMSFSKQFLDACDRSGGVAHLISSYRERASLAVGRHRVENLPRSGLYSKKGIRHHLGAMLYGLAIAARAVHERPTVMIVDSGTAPWFVLSLLSLFHIPIIAVLHNALWPMGFPPRRRRDRFLCGLDGWFFRHIAAATVCVSPECERQVRTVAGTPKGPVFQCRPQYRDNFLSRVPSVPSWPFHPFNVLFLGRMEESKGVFLILSMAEQLEQQMPDQFRWRIVGAGSASDALERRIQERNLNRIVEARAMLRNEAAMLETLGWAHAMIVPTTSQFKEGLAMTAVESVLAGRPVVLSSVVPAWEILGSAAIKIEIDGAATEHMDSFTGIFRRLAQDAEYYEQHRRATADVQAEFYDRSRGLGAVLMRAVAALR